MIGLLRAPAGLLLILAGCDSIWDLEPVSFDAGTQGDGSVAPSGERPAFCNGGLFDAFDTPMDPTSSCVFGSTNPPEMTELVRQTGGELIMTIPGDDQVFVGCTAYRTYDFTSAGVFLRVTEVLTVPWAYTKLGVRSPDDTFSANILFEDGVLRFTVNGEILAQREDAPGWWRMRNQGGTELVAELSGDGIVWETWHVESMTVSPDISADIGAGIDQLPSSIGTARFSAFGICP